MNLVQSYKAMRKGFGLSCHGGKPFRERHQSLRIRCYDCQICEKSRESVLYDLYIEQEVHDIPVFYHIIFTFGTNQAFFFCGSQVAAAFD